ncbi:hypothetical protein K435DRAFT_678014 [Dendrothele bispora CBS 962.96]|uniref:Uncharacterized protein n=1 Tax=Dendrothele bispora (strain CBS 962.96) TaxID=1314807 RepID=A0A4S8LJR9_DENBC|nr:hypothetical protein K435DRAFT_678014 [Dendrothele bispora CBS 962.96]
MEGTDLEELLTQLKLADGLEDDDVDSFIDELDAMTVEECKDMEKHIKSVKIILVKVSCNISFKIINSMTKLAWKDTLTELQLEKVLPHDMETRWNLTYYMTNTACDYQSAVDAMTAKKLYEL